MTQEQNNKWYKWFRREVSFYEYYRFYFPTDRNHTKAIAICWIWYLVPFVLVIKLCRIAVIAVYKDVLYTIEDWIDYRNLVNKETK